MKKVLKETKTKFSLEKFKVAELKNQKTVVGGNKTLQVQHTRCNDDDENTITIPTSRWD